MNRRPTLLVFVLLIGTACGLSADSLVQAPAFPTPPEQGKPWSLPEGVDDPEGRIKSTIETIFGLGLADPRACSYRHVTVKEGGAIHKARGWVLPDSQGDSLRHAIGWNGLIYPVESVGEGADFAADLKILRAKGAFGEEPFDNYQEESLEKLLAEFGGTPRMMRAWAAPYLLLRLGHPVGFHEKKYPADPFVATHVAPKCEPWTYSSGVYLDSDYFWLVQYARLIRADGVAAFVDKNDRLAAMRLQAFDRVWAEIVRRFPHQEGDDDGDADPFNAPLSRPRLNSSWRDLLVDAQRRLGPAEANGPTELTKQIAGWDRLETWDDDAPPTEFAKVVAAGPAAIEPLLDCLENDRRWTRIRFGDPGDSTRFLRVRDLAIFALERVLRFPVVEVSNRYVPVEEPWYVEAAATMRAFCRKYENAWGGDLWFRILEDESADLDHQAMAAKSIVMPTDSRGYYPLSDDFFYFPDAWDLFGDPNASKEGKTLRGRREPSVLDLMERAWRRQQVAVEKRLAAGEPETIYPGFVCSMPWALRSEAHRFVRWMEEWQPGNVEVLKSHYDWLAEAVFNLREDNGFGFMVSGLCEETLIRRFWSDDDTAMQDYEKLFRSSFEAGRVPIGVMKALPEIPGMDQFAKEAFLGEAAPLSLINKPWKRYDSRESLIEWESPLLVLPSYRRALVEALKAQGKQGTLVVAKEGATLAYLSGEPGEDSELGKSAALLCTDAAGSSLDVRLCDLVAYFLTPKHGSEVWITPAFHLDDPLPLREAAIADWIKLLEANQ